MPTSVPVRDGRSPEVDSAGRAFTVVSIGDQARATARAWVRRIGEMDAPLTALHHTEADEEAVASLAHELRGATVGWRLLLAGPETDVLLLEATALREGALRAEIRAHITDTSERRTRCTHCGRTTRSRTPVGAMLPCAGCGRTLVVYHHVSRRHAAYMGFMADAEEAP
ncbi:dimethylamine monooxygenase subunit DmmA family protein [Streptomyces sp. NPDC048430]|uniref:dimethylamine monooxygenase subunit DmmA family protein n=1 Tax=Streptomyces sp. NPDC048430 TaxID=3155388 RepID=UPI0034236AB1